LIPIFAILWGLIFLKEAITLNLILGVIVIVLGVALIIFNPFKKKTHTLKG